MRARKMQERNRRRGIKETGKSEKEKNSSVRKKEEKNGKEMEEKEKEGGI